MLADYELSDENLAAVDDHLNIPLYYGYTERTVYAKGQLRRVELLYNGETSPVYINPHAGGYLLSILTWPLRLFKKDMDEEIKDISIPPMLNKKL